MIPSFDLDDNIPDCVNGVYPVGIIRYRISTTNGHTTLREWRFNGNRQYRKFLQVYHHILKDGQSGASFPDPSKEWCAVDNSDSVSCQE